MDYKVGVNNQIESAIQGLYANNQFKLKQICNKEMARFGGLSNMFFASTFCIKLQKVFAGCCTYIL